MTRAVWRLFLCAAIGGTANGIFAFVAGVVTASATGSTLAVGSITTAATLPWLILSAPAGVVIDRIGPISATIIGNVGRALTLAIAAVAMATNSVPLGYILPGLVFVVASLQTLVDAASEVATVDLVEPATLTRANGWMSMATRLFYQFVAPAAGGALLPLGHWAPGAVGAAACLAAALMVLPLPRVRPEPNSETASDDKARGLKLVLRQPTLASLVVVGAITTIANATYMTSFTVHAVSPDGLRLSPATFGVLTGLTGVGAAFGAVASHRVEQRLGQRATLMMTRFGWAIVFSAPLVTQVQVLGLLTLIGSFFGGMWAVVSLSVRQRVVRREDLGRVAGVFRMLTYGMTPVGGLLGGALGMAIPATALFVACSVVSLVTIIPIRIYLSDTSIAAAMEAASATHTQEEGPDAHT